MFTPRRAQAKKNHWTSSREDPTLSIGPESQYVSSRPPARTPQVFFKKGVNSLVVVSRERQPYIS